MWKNGNQRVKSPRAVDCLTKVRKTITVESLLNSTSNDTIAVHVVLVVRKLLPTLRNSCIFAGLSLARAKIGVVAMKIWWKHLLPLNSTVLAFQKCKWNFALCGMHVNPAINYTKSHVLIRAFTVFMSNFVRFVTWHGSTILLTANKVWGLRKIFLYEIVGHEFL